MPNLKNKFNILKKPYLAVVGVLLLLVLAIFLMCFNNITSTQSEPALIAQVYLDGEYRI